MHAGTILRIARPTDNLAAIAAMYVKGLDFTVLAQFQDHAGFDGIILGTLRGPHSASHSIPGRYTPMIPASRDLGV
jgi:hypothetical protein